MQGADLLHHSLFQISLAHFLVSCTICLAFENGSAKSCFCEEDLKLVALENVGHDPQLSWKSDLIMTTSEDFSKQE